jgi:hypothetical protein
MAADATFGQVIFSPPVLLTFLVCLVLGAAVTWLLLWRERRLRNAALAQQRNLQEGTIERLLSSFGADKDQVQRDHEHLLGEKDERIASLERENARLRDRLTSSGLLGVFGGGKREIVSALLLENEQLHELLASKQADVRDLMDDMTHRLLDRLDEQAQESARAVRYKQALLSAFLQQQETRQLLDRFVSDSNASPAQLPGDDDS